jgi:glycosyltransferase involved in cell wall biosynthesis
MPSAALVMIARDAAGTIRQCLESARGVVDRMIVVDTGSLDETVAIAESLGAEVHHFAWCDDFAAARNHALACADSAGADWRLILDADEWLAPPETALRQALSSEPAFIGLLPIASLYEQAGEDAVSLSWIPRLLPRGAHYRGRVHEQPQLEVPRRRIDSRVHHSGYRRDAMARKRGRNRALLQRMLSDTPDDPYLLYQLGRDHEVYGEFETALEHLDRALALTEPAAGFRHDLVVRTLYTLKKLGHFEPAVQFAEQEMANWEHSPDFFFALGDLLLDWAAADPAKGMQELLPMIEASWQRCLEIGEQPGLEGNVVGRGSHLAAHNLAVLYAGIGDQPRAAEFQALADQMRARRPT